MAIPEIGEGKRGIEGYFLYLLRQANTAVQNSINEELAKYDLSLAQYSALTMIKAYGGLSNAELARLTLLKPQSVNEVVLRLDSRGLVRREKDSRHGRIVRLSITRRGAALLKKARRRTDGIEAALLEHAGAHEQSIKAWLVSIARTARAHPGD